MTDRDAEDAEDLGCGCGCMALVLMIFGMLFLVEHLTVGWRW